MFLGTNTHDLLKAFHTNLTKINTTSVRKKSRLNETLLVLCWNEMDGNKINCEHKFLLNVLHFCLHVILL